MSGVLPPPRDRLRTSPPLLASLLTACGPELAPDPFAGADSSADSSVSAGVVPGRAPLPDTGLDPDTGTTTLRPPENVLLLLTDDIGIDKTAVYAEHLTPASTPNIDALAASGVLFRNYYTHPTCSPSRASLLTGREPTRHGIGRWIYADTETWALQDEELTIPELLDRAEVPWSTALLGKWHLVGFRSPSPTTHPLDSGFDHHAGSLGNPQEAVQSGNTPRGYENWEKATDGEVAWTTTYMTVDTFDDAVAAIGSLPEPWFLVVATNGAHTPLHDPPPELLDAPLPEGATELEQYTAMVQVVDDGIGRLLAAFPTEVRERTTIVYTTDNGTPREVDVIQAPWDPDRSKQTVYGGAINVPFIVAGPRVAVPGSECAAFVQDVDLLPTVAEIAGISVDTLVGADGAPLLLDGTSFLPLLADPSAPSLRTHAWSEQFYPNGHPDTLEWRDRMVRDEDWKLARHEVWEEGVLTTTYELFRMEEGAWDEGEDLLSAGPLDADAQAAWEELLAELEARAGTLDG